MRPPHDSGHGLGTLRERLVVLGGSHTRVLESPGTGAPILFLHGFSDSADTWRPVLGQLARLGRRAVAVDLPGFGHAARLPRGNSFLAPLDAFVDAVVHAYGDDEDCIVAGNSLGATLALRAAERDLPVAGAVAISPAGLAMSTQAWHVDRVLQASLVKMALRAPLSPRVVQRAAAFAYGRYAGRGVDHSVAQLYGQHFVGGLRDVRRYRAMAGVLAAEVRAGPYHLDCVRVPILMLWGDRDPFCPVRGARMILDAVPDARLVVLEGCGHCAQLEAPAVIAREVDAMAGNARTR